MYMRTYMYQNQWWGIHNLGIMNFPKAPERKDSMCEACEADVSKAQVSDNGSNMAPAASNGPMGFECHGM